MFCQAQCYNSKGLACVQMNVPVLDKLKQSDIPVLQWNMMDKYSKLVLPANKMKFKVEVDSGHNLKSNQL
jgi:hypothetical protein